MGESGVMPDAEGLGSSGLAERFAAWHERWRELPEHLTALLLFGSFVRSRHPGRYYVKAQRLRRTIRRAYDDVLSDYDLLLMPTTPMAATPLPRPDASAAERSRRAGEMLANTAPFNVTGHPAISLPCGATGDGEAGGDDAGGAAFRRNHHLSGGVCVRANARGTGKRRVSMLKRKSRGKLPSPKIHDAILSSV